MRTNRARAAGSGESVSLSLHVGGEELEAFPLQALALQLACAAHGFGGFAGTTLRRLFEMAAQLHFPENALALHLFLERFQRLIDIVITDENLHLAAYSFMGDARTIR